MTRIYKTIRLAYETRYWIDRLIEHKNKQLQEHLNLNMQQHIEEDILSKYPLDGVALTITLNVTIGSIIELAVKEAENLSPEDWISLEKEIKVAKNKINSFVEPSTTPRILFSLDAYHKLGEMQRYLKPTGKRAPILPYIIKVVVYNLYKKTLLSGTK